MSVFEITNSALVIFKPWVLAKIVEI
jgi:hypothetical protein